MPRRVDANQAEIVEALREVGASVVDLHKVGSGCPDICVGFRTHNYLMEIKGADGVLTPREREWQQAWRGWYAVVRTPWDALRLIGAVDAMSPSRETERPGSVVARIRTVEATERPLSGRDPSARATLERVPVLRDEAIHQALVALEEQNEGAGTTDPGSESREEAAP